MEGVDVNMRSQASMDCAAPMDPNYNFEDEVNSFNDDMVNQMMKFINENPSSNTDQDWSQMANSSEVAIPQFKLGSGFQDPQYRSLMTSGEMLLQLTDPSSAPNFNFNSLSGTNPPSANEGTPLFSGSLPTTPSSSVAATPQSGFSTPAMNVNRSGLTPENYIPLSPQTNGNFRDVPTPQQATPDPSSLLLANLHSCLASHNEQLKKILQFQNQVMNNPQNETFTQLNNEHEQLKKSIDSEIKSLLDMQTKVVLNPHEVRKAFYLYQELQAQNMQLELYHQELQQLRYQQPGTPVRCFAALVVIEQPFPLAVTKGKALDDPVIVKLLTGSNVNIQSVSKVKVSLIMDNTQVRGTAKVIENEAETMDEYQRTAKFHLKFLAGTRKALATVKFGVQIQLPGTQPILLESNPSLPFIVITNESQFEEADGMLLRTEVFGPQADSLVNWPAFANKLQRHFLRGTRQDPVKPQRFLSRTEMAYLHQKFFNSYPQINAKAFDDFWNWFGKGLQKIRYQRHLCSMWQSGLLYGFVSREGVNAALMQQEVGTFLIRFSESHPGAFAIGYTIDDPNPQTRVRHYLIRPEDVYAGRKTLPDYLMECNQFSKFLQISYNLHTGNPNHRIIDKEHVLEPYGAKRNSPEPNNTGYDGSLVGQAQTPSSNFDSEDFM